jgi:hypothetical protein
LRVCNSVCARKQSPLTYMDYLGYHYLAGMIYIGCKEWEKAREMLLAVSLRDVMRDTTMAECACVDLFG